MRVQLYTKDEHVAEIAILPFKTAPMVIVWGTRFFVRDDPKDDQETRYNECFGWVTNPTLDAHLKAMEP